MARAKTAEIRHPGYTHSAWPNPWGPGSFGRESRTPAFQNKPRGYPRRSRNWWEDERIMFELQTAAKSGKKGVSVSSQRMWLRRLANERSIGDSRMACSGNGPSIAGEHYPLVYFSSKTTLPSGPKKWASLGRSSRLA